MEVNKNYAKYRIFFVTYSSYEAKILRDISYQTNKLFFFNLWAGQNKYNKLFFAIT